MKLARTAIVASCAAIMLAASASSAFAQGAHARRGRAVHRPPVDLHSRLWPSFSPYRSYYGDPFGYGFGRYGSGLGYPPAAYSAAPTYGSVRITDAPPDAEVYVDGYYAGVVDDFDGVFQRLNLTPGPHRVEIRPAGSAPRTFDVSVQAGRTLRFRAKPLP